MTDSISYLYSLESRGIKLGLKRTLSLLNDCNNPQNKLRCIQIAGTNGKGSVSAMISNALFLFGYKVGLYTSPHLIHLNERIRINGISIQNRDINFIINKHKKMIEKNEASFFEAMTMMAFTYFVNQKVDVAILETGLGGQYDSVTTCKPEATVLTPISMDHREILGDTIEKITYEKAGIIKKNIPIFSSKQNKKVENILNTIAKDNQSSIYFCKYNDSFKLKFLKGKHQEENAQLAYDVINNLFNINSKKLKKYILEAKWPGRYQIIKNTPYIIFDVGHNEDSINVFLDEYLKETISGKKYLIIVLQDRKNIKKISKRINSSFDQIICSQTPSKFSMKAEKLFNIFEKEKTEIIYNVKEAILKINDKLEENDSLAIIGSHYLGETILSVYKKTFDKL